jgi:hypothetical protein
MGALQPTFAADLGSGPPPPSVPSRGWTVSVTPYAWLPFLQGDVTVKGRTVDIDVNPFELLEHLDAVPFMATPKPEGDHSLSITTFSLPRSALMPACRGLCVA